MAPIEPTQFVELVQPLLARQDVQGLCGLLKSRWHPEQFRQLLSSHHTDAKKVALLALALIGPNCCVPELAIQLRDPDPMINQLAEHALWAIWFRGGKSAEVNHLVCQGAQALNQKEFNKAVDLFSEAIRTDPDFAEAYHQRGIAHYLLEEYEKSIGDCQRTIRRMPCHFGAWAGMGHGHAHLGQNSQAIECYEKALQINPHLSCVSEAIEELKKRA